MLRPNWFDNRYYETFKDASAQEVMKVLAQDETILGALQEALDQWAANQQHLGWIGASRTQVIRMTLADVVQRQN